MKISRNLPLIVSTTAALALLVAVPALAQQDSDRDNKMAVKPTSETAQQPGQNLAARASSQDMSPVDRASQIIGKEVKNSAGESLGSIDELVINKSQNRIAYAVLLHGDTMGIGGKWIAVPFHALRYDQTQGSFLLNATPAQLESMRGFEEDNWPDTAGSEFSAMNNANTDTTRADKAYDKSDKDNKQPNQYGSDTPDPKNQQVKHDQNSWGTDKADHNKRSRKSIRADWSVDNELRWQNRVSQLIGINVVDKAGKELGSLNDLAIELHDGRIAYGVLKFSDAWYDYSGKLFPIPWDKYDYKTSSSERQLQLNATQEQFKNAEGFDPDAWSDMADQSWGENTHENYGSQPYWHMYEYPYLAPGHINGTDRPGQNPNADRNNTATDRQRERDNASGTSQDNQQ